MQQRSSSSWSCSSKSSYVGQLKRQFGLLWPLFSTFPPLLFSLAMHLLEPSHKNFSSSSDCSGHHLVTNLGCAANASHEVSSSPPSFAKLQLFRLIRWHVPE